MKEHGTSKGKLTSKNKQVRESPQYKKHQKQNYRQSDRIRTMQRRFQKYTKSLKQSA